MDGCPLFKVVNLTRLGLSMNDVDKVFGRFVKELYILSQMKSQRWVAGTRAIWQGACCEHPDA